MRPDPTDYDTGPPTIEDDAWFQEHVVSRGYPKLHKVIPLNGQTTLEEFTHPSSCRHESWILNSRGEARCSRCGQYRGRPS